jgi:tRNA nucleotidyltransferase (CCA-adding enzyme)
MEIALAHMNMDFDSLAAELALTKLYPGVRMVPGYPLAANIRAFFSLYRDLLPLSDLNYVAAEKIKHIFIVDCQHAERLDETARGILKAGCPYTIFDHHKLDPNGLGPGAQADSLIKSCGSTTSLLVDRLMARKIVLTPFEATLLAIGIYEDTGCLTYSGTSALDAACVSYLLTHGADLCQVNNFINPKLTGEQSEILEKLIRHSRIVDVGGAKAVIAHGAHPRYVEGVATMTRRLLELMSADAAIAVVHMRDRIHIVGRSDTPRINVREIIIQFGGDGHPGAASAVSKQQSLGEILEKLEALLTEQTVPEAVAHQMMISPVRTIRPETTMDEAWRLMLRYGQDGLIVVDDGEIAGIVSRRDVDKALHHKLSHAPVRGFMSRPVISIGERTPLSEIQKLMIKHDIGRLPVLDDDDKLLGIVSRKEVLHTLYGMSRSEDEGELAPIMERRFKMAERLEGIDEPTRWLFHELGKVAAANEMVAYAVGGCVRDLFLGLPNFDLDFVVEGSAIELALALEAAYPSRFAVIARHDRFQTATVMFQADRPREIDLSTARTEFYEFPAALPTVEASVLEHDLFRRDFTINALAICLNPDRFGELIDFFCGIKDIEDKSIRILHQVSFIEDPTRIVRAARFAARLGFTIEERTRRQAERAIALGVFDDLGGFRLKEELKLILCSPHRLKALELLQDIGGGLRYLAAPLVLSRQARFRLRRAQRLLSVYPVKDDWVVYLGLLLAELSIAEIEVVLGRLSLANDERDWIVKGLELPARVDPNLVGGSLSRSSIYEQLEGESDRSLAIAACLAPPGSSVRRSIKLYLDELRHVNLVLSGGDLIKFGFPQGPEIKEALSAIHKAKLDGQVVTREDEVGFIKTKYSHLIQSVK